MRARRLLIVLAIFATLAIILFALIPREPKYQGRTLSEWIKDSAPRRSPDPEQTRAVEAVRHIGTNGLPWLIKWISAREPRDWQINLTSAGAPLPRWVRLKLLPSLFGINSYYAHRRVALDGFLILGPQAAPAVPDLFRIMTASTKPLSAVPGALDSIGTAGVPAALNIVTNSANSFRLRFAAEYWIIHIDPKVDEPDAAPLMIQCLREKDPDFSPMAASILAARRLEPELVIPFLINWLTNSNPNIRYGAARGLQQYGERATSAVPGLVICLKNSFPYVRKAAEDALFEIDPATLEKADPGVAELKKHWRRVIDTQQPIK